MRSNCSKSAPDLDAVYVPIGMGSGICGLITVRDLLGLKTEIVGVVAENAPAFATSFAAGRPHPRGQFSAHLCGRCGVPRSAGLEAFEIVKTGAARVVTVSEDEIAKAHRIYYTTTHNLTEGAGAVSLAALLKERARYAGKPGASSFPAAISTCRCSPKLLRGETPPA